MAVVLDMDYSSTTTDPNKKSALFMELLDMGYVALWQEDHSKIKDGKAKSALLR